MPAQYDMKPQPVFAGMVCDVCGEAYAGGSYDFVLEYNFGYGTHYDGSSVKAAICDSCLYNLIKTHVHNAQWTET